MSLDEILWLTSRTAALTAFFVLAAALITGQALRTASLDGVVRNRDLLSLHRFLMACWVPFVGLHIVTMLLDPVARIAPLDVVVPFRASYSALSIGLGTAGFDLLIVVTATSFLKRQLDAVAWRWLHRLSYVMFGIFVAHALLSGTDFARPVVLAAAAAVVAFIVIMTFARVIFGRLDTVCPLDSGALDSWRRAIDFIRAVDERAAEQVVPYRWGRAFVNLRLRFVHDLNYLVADRTDGATASLLIAEAERLQSGSGLLHRRVNVDDQAAAARLSPDFEAQGFLAERFVIMARHEPDESVVASKGAREIEWPSLRPARELELKRQPWARNAELVDQILAKHELTARTTNTRYFAVMIGETAVSSCELRSDGRTAQIETVETLDEFRNRGYARAVIAAALAAARGHDLVFLVTDAGDWPQQLYRRLGFEEVGIESRFLRIDARQTGKQ